MATSDRSRVSGFTLMEMLVVMLIAGIAIALTSQALGQYQRAYARVVTSERGGREIRLSEAWFRQSVRGLYPTDPAKVPGLPITGTKPGQFRGDADGFSGLTLSPVLGGQGVPALQTWQVTRTAVGATLSLAESGSTIALVLPAARDLRLHYLDPEGKLHDQWPPRLGLSEQLPQAIVLELIPGDVRMPVQVVAAAVLGSRNPDDIPFEPSSD